MQLRYVGMGKRLYDDIVSVGKGTGKDPPNILNRHRNLAGWITKILQSCKGKRLEVNP
jgi:hypothetical protein